MTMTRQVARSGQVAKSPIVSTSLRVFIPGMQDIGSGVPLDRSGKSVAIPFGAGQIDTSATTSLWGNPAFLTTKFTYGGNGNTANNGGISDGGIDIPIGALAPGTGAVPWNILAGHALLMVYQVKVPTFPATGTSWSFYGTSSPGFNASFANTGKMQNNTFSTSGSSAYGPSASTASVADGLLHTIIDYIDPIAKTRAIYIDSVNADSITSLASLAGSAAPTTNLCFGNSANASSNGSIAAQFRNIAIYTWIPASSLTTAQMSAILNRLITSGNVYQPLPASLLP